MDTMNSSRDFASTNASFSGRDESTLFSNGDASELSIHLDDIPDIFSLPGLLNSTDCDKTTADTTDENSLSLPESSREEGFKFPDAGVAFNSTPLSNLFDTNENVYPSKEVPIVHASVASQPDQAGMSNELDVLSEEPIDNPFSIGSFDTDSNSHKTSRTWMGTNRFSPENYLKLEQQQPPNHSKQVLRVGQPLQWANSDDVVHETSNGEHEHFVHEPTSLLKELPPIKKRSSSTNGTIGCYLPQPTAALSTTPDLLSTSGESVDFAESHPAESSSTPKKSFDWSFIADKERRRKIERWKSKRERIAQGLVHKRFYRVRVKHARMRPRQTGRFLPLNLQAERLPNL